MAKCSEYMLSIPYFTSDWHSRMSAISRQHPEKRQPPPGATMGAV
jgi:hypothetical protein